MGIKTDIEWCDSTLNLQMGCDGCELWNPKAGVRHCYAGTLTERYAGQKGWPAAFEEPRIFPERLKAALSWPDLTGKDRSDKPWLNGYPRVIFLDDMGDTFTESLPLDWLEPFTGDMMLSPHIWMILTKRPSRMVEFWRRWLYPALLPSAFPENFWLLTSVTGPENVGRIKELLKLRALGARVLGVSYEPALGAIDLSPYTHSLSLCIVGGESGPHARPSHPQWFRDVKEQCRAAGVSFFMKQITERGQKIPFDQWPDYLKVREFPEKAEVAREPAA